NYADMLKKHGYQVSAYADRKSAADGFRTKLPDLALLDIGLGDEPAGGFTRCRELRAMSAALPIIFLTARDSDLDMVSGLRIGADDYLTKDASLPQLLARISALFRRADLLREPPASEETLERGQLRLDMKRFQAIWRDAAVDLTLTEFWLVHSLARFPGHVKQMEKLLRDGQEQALLATARAIATALHDRPQLLELRAGQPASGEMELILKSLSRADSRIWIVDQHQRLLALAGDLKKRSADE